jgi:nucleotide-binding universal stress UspA family protein
MEMHGALGMGERVTVSLRAPRGLRRLGVATDFSLRAEFALARALRLPLGVEATFDVLHVRAPDSEEPQGVRVPVERCLHRTVTSARRRLKARADVRVHEAVRAGEPVAQTHAYAQEARTELVVVGRPHVTRERALREDSTVRALLRRVGAPLLVVVPHPVRAYERPLVAVDFSEDSRRALELTLRLCPAPTRVDVVHVFTFQEAVTGNGADTLMARLLREQAAERAARVALGRFLAPYREAGREFELYVREGLPGETVRNEADALGADLLALGMAEASAEASEGGPGLAERVVGAVDCDVLVAKEPPA